MPLRWTEAEIADLQMAGELYAASPDGEEQYRRALEDLPSGSMTVQLDPDGEAE